MPSTTPRPAATAASGRSRVLLGVLVGVLVLVVLGGAALVLGRGDDAPSATPISERSLALSVVDDDASPGGEDALVQSGDTLSDGRVALVGCTFDEFCTQPGIWFDSPDGSWTRVDPADLGDGIVTAIVEHDGGFVAVGERFDVDTSGEEPVAGVSDPTVWRSSDGTSWEQVDPAGLGRGSSEGNRRFFGVDVLGGELVGFLADVPPADSDGGVLVTVATSSDGETWTEVDDRTFGGIDFAAGFEEFDGRYVVFASAEDAPDRDSVELFTTTDGRSWEQVDAAGIDTGALVYDTAVFEGELYAVGAGPGGGGVVWATDGLGERWREVHQVGGPDELAGLLAVPGGLLAFGSTGDGEDVTPAVWVSDDGQSWEQATVEGADEGFWLAGGTPRGPDAIVVIGGLADERADGTVRDVWDLELG